VNGAGLAATAILVAGFLLIGREDRRGRPASGAVLAGSALALAGSAWGGTLIAEGPWWPLALVPLFCALSAGKAMRAVLGARRKAGRP
jgi:hypothetical protein